MKVLVIGGEGFIGQALVCLLYTSLDEGTDDMIFDCTRLIETLTRFMVLEPGDLICTGSPSGNGIHHGVLLKAGDVMESTVTGAFGSLGTQRNACVAEKVVHA